ncbi:MAG: TonB-dependent receptor [Prolixibacteraceae bacterium]|nr:TonB-dependent receptor [Prolixibacteraceae bacterium]
MKRVNVPVSFRKWNNKGYSVFNSLKRVVKISTLSVAYLLFANPESISASPVDTVGVARNVDLESIDVTGNEQPETYSGISRVVLTITKSEIEQAALSSINELLEYAGNIDIRQRGTNGVQADVSIRGGTFDQVLILLNGVNITDPQTGHHNLNLPVDFSLIERIEILKGPGAQKFGPGAFSGAINIITTKTDRQFVKAEVFAGEYGLNAQKINAALNLGLTSHLFSASRSASKGYIENTDYTILDFFYKGSVDAKIGAFDLQTGISVREFGANSFYSAKYPNQFEAIQNYYASIAYVFQKKNISIEPKFYFRKNNDRFLLFRNNPSLYENNHSTNVYGANVQANIVHGAKGVTSFGGNLRNESIYSNNLGTKAQTPRQSPINDSIWLDKTHSRRYYSIFAGHKRYYNNIMLNAGLNLTHNSDLPNKIFLFPGIDVSYSFYENSSIYASINRTMRMPTFTDLYYTSPMNQGNVNLMPESATGFELGYKYNPKNVSLGITGFYIKGENMIDWVRETLNDKWQTINHTNINTLGTEFLFRVNVEQLLPKQQIIKNVSFAFTYIDQQKLSSELISNYALNYLKHRADLNIVHKVIKNVEANWHFAYQHRNGQYEQYSNGNAVNLVNYQPFFSGDLKITWSYSGWNIYLQATNLFDVDYYDFGNIAQPGRWIKAGITKQVGWNNN